jgi:hypothetical protein
VSQRVHHAETHAPGFEADEPNRSRGDSKPYWLLGLALSVNLVVMFALTYVGVDKLDDVFVNINRFYMALIMVAPMAIVMLLVMRHMFTNVRLNIALVAVAALVFGSTFAAIRSQAFVGDEQFLRSMIPHHSIAIKTCERADVQDREIVELCTQIVDAQEREIAQMREILERLTR